MSEDEKEMQATKIKMMKFAMIFGLPWAACVLILLIIIALK